MSQRTFCAVVIAAGAIACAWLGYQGWQWWTARTAAMPLPPRTAVPPPPPPVRYADWNTFHGDSALVGVADAVLPSKLAPLWHIKTGAAVRQTPVIHGGRVFFATAHGEVFCAGIDGTKLWSRELLTGETKDNAPVKERIDSPWACFDNTLLVGTVRGALYALDAATGTQRWQVVLDSPTMGTPVFRAADAKPARAFVIERGDGVALGLDLSSGNVLWKSKGVERCDGSPSVGPDALVFGSCASALHVLSPESGEHLRDIPLGKDAQVAGGVALVAGRAISGSRGGKVFEADVSAGKLLWTNTDCESEVFSTPAANADCVVASSNDGDVFAIDRATGKTKWKIKTGMAASSPVIAGDKVVVTDDGTLFLLSLADGAKLWESKISDDLSSPAVSGDRVFVGSEDGTVWAFGPNSPKGTPAQ